ncbi:SWI/SNF-related matrix-associated actin-dependent regulator of chromatin subfamily A containing DEAD/H box 1 homolog isoform X1 [Lutzomyia longipalpis]|uniref:SWI/SNF-related matrix-associated actin-dependent regulator of chromatin subfamily A containing DEAD/H box 1 homolog isoform X1 n=1 Tax=Lutzomyia longipalpis TaxID=7200 RepID=UPI0024842BDF|nr:SWI/SNF-related matrix-associated actin-dependent regulator of chromatin subfamily A containing DEAD/H box 1 homolog isoform X1 [Lutzomyia longipalpis]
MSLRSVRIQKHFPSSVNAGTFPGSTGDAADGGSRKRKLSCDGDELHGDGGEMKTLAVVEVIKPVQVLTLREKEIMLQTFRRLEPNAEILASQDCLVRSNWDLEKARQLLRERKFERSSIIVSQRTTSSTPIQPTSSASSASSGYSSSNSTPKKIHVESKAKKPRLQEAGGSDDSEDPDACQPQDKVFDSDLDSDDDDTEHLSRERKAVLKYINESTLQQLVVIKTCSLKKAQTIVESRPYVTWSSLVDAMQNNRYLSTDILNNCQELLRRRKNISQIMKKCTKMAKRLEVAVAEGGELVKQPSIIPETLKLAEYQMIGLNWLVAMHNEKTNGILADEMGLGKTIQVIAFLAYLKENDLVRKPHLIVVPSSTLCNWENEIMRWCPSFVVEKYYGSLEERKNLRIRWAKGGLKDTDIVLTTYHMVASLPEERKMFRTTQMCYAIFDEAHMLKNMTTQRYDYLDKINSERRILLTGTPLQNNLLELMSLLCFVMPSLFAKRQDDIRNLFSRNAKNQVKVDEEEDGKVNGNGTESFEQNQIDQAKRIMRPFVLRRLKRDVLKYLPPKTDEVKLIPMTEAQGRKYRSLVEKYTQETGVVKGTAEFNGLAIMMEMRKLANHPLLMRYHYTDAKLRDIARRLAIDTQFKATNADYIYEDLLWRSDFYIHQLTQKYRTIGQHRLPIELILESGKFQHLDKLLPKLKAEGHRVLIFSQFTIMMDILEAYMKIRDIDCLRLDGSTNVSDRQDLIDNYNMDDNVFVFLLSTRAGGLGINLTAADTVIIHDIDFNPYNDKQAEDRCHRMGQTKPVHIYKFISEGTIEEGMLMVAQDKLKLEQEVTNANDSPEEDRKSMVRLLTLSLGMDSERAEKMISTGASGKNFQE